MMRIESNSNARRTRMHVVSKETGALSGYNYFNYSIEPAQKFVPKKYLLPASNYLYLFYLQGELVLIS